MAVVSRVAVLTFSGVTGSRTWRAEAVTQDTAAGSSVTINFTQSTTGATPPGTANNERSLILKDDAGNTIRTFTWAEGATTDTFTFHFTSDGTSGGAARCGTVGMTLRVHKTNGGPTATYEAESDGAPDTPPTGFTTTAADVGWVRGTTTATVKVNKSALADAAFTGTYAYPDSVFMRTTLGAQAYVTARTITNAVGAVLSNATAQAAAQQYDSTFSSAIDSRFSTGNHTATVTAVQNSTLTGSAWTVLNITTQVLSVDATVTLSNLTSTSGGLSKVYNRNEQAAGTVDVTNARGEGFTPRGTATLTSIDTGGGVEGSIGFSRSGATYTWNITFATSGNVAPATDAGSAKLIRWRDSPANSPTPADSSTYGLLSSKLNLAVHLQERQTALDPALDTDGRNASVIGYYGFKVTNVRGEAYNGAQGKISLQPDDDSLAEVVSTTLTSATINGHAGYTPLQSWSDPLPDGGWDIWASTSFTKDGNTGTKARSGSGVYDVSLIAANPDYVVYLHVGSDDSDGHNVAGSDFEVRCMLVDTRSRTVIAVDEDGGVPSAVVVLRRVRDGVTEYLDSAEQWQPAHSASDVSATADSHQLTKVAGQFLYTKTFSDTADWTNDITVLLRLEKGGSPYTAAAVREITGADNSHSGYGLDAVALATAGVISFK